MNSRNKPHGRRKQSRKPRKPLPLNKNGIPISSPRPPKYTLVNEREY
ncbi:hypothetical protein JOD43_003910 [Pullulanibacillus pueri]|uniref:Uncharacterized protein n=1 Tax=Pullulanibacillus pueri TaxID=1437324 RepID=A0A8J2ZXF4_9BACL|nr:hypothetical protein [Pullulanibacillus pueri]GGH85138.1 hypothetical protein GCM10007096_29830 [Pullulanibacillus pueri]